MSARKVIIDNKSQCTKCKEFKDLSYFAIKSNGSPYCHCYPCIAKTSREYRIKNYPLPKRDRRVYNKKYKPPRKIENNNYLLKIRSNTPCADCNKQFHFVAMEFDHIPERGPKRFLISVAASSYSMEILQEELAKCEVVCSNCHRLRSENRRKRLTVDTVKQSYKHKFLRKQKLHSAVNKIKDTECKDCNLKFDPIIMDFDHIRGDKVADVAELVGQGYSLELILKEIEKCEIICSNCHKIRTYDRLVTARALSETLEKVE